MTYLNTLKNYQKFEHEEPVTLGDGKTVAAIGKGDIEIQLNNGKTHILKNVLCVPRLSCNLLSVGAAADYGYKIEFTKKGCCFKNSNGQTIATGSRVNKMYRLNIKQSECAHVADCKNKFQLWQLFLKFSS